MNLGKTASVKSVTTDTKILDAKKVETAELLVDGVSISEVVPKWKPREHIYRCVLEEDDDYIIYDDEGNFLDCKLDKLENGSNLFQYVKGVENFSFSLPSLTNGSNMFANCNLGEKAVESILRTIPEYSEGSHPLTMNMSPDAFEKFNKITGNYLMEPGTISYKGWEIASNAVVALPEGYRKVEYLEGTGTQYITSGVELTNDSIVTSRFRVSNLHTYGFIFGARYAVKVNAFCLYVDTMTWLNYGSQADNTSCPVLQRNVDYDFHAQANTWTINNEVYTLEPEPAFNAGECYIFNQNENGVVDTRFFAGRVYSFAISNGSDKHKFVPAIDPTGAPCMFDIVSRKSHYNAGSGDFLYPTENTTYALRRVLPDWGKLTEHGLRRLYHAPEGYTGELIDYALENGYKAIVEAEQPADGYWSPRWTETEEEIILEWDIASNVIEEEMTDV